MTHVLVHLESGDVPGLLLKWHSSGEQALVTYEIDGRVATEWLPVAQIIAVSEPASDLPV